MSVQRALFGDPKNRAIVNDPPPARWLFSDTRSAPLWLIIRLWLGWNWLDAGLHKAEYGNFAKSAWFNGGTALKAYWDKALAVPVGGKGASITFDWYYNFLRFMNDNQWYTWFAWLIVLGEIAVGLGLITGTLTGIAAFFGTLMNMSFLLAGSTSTNPLMFGLAVFVILAWKVAGWWGIDRWLLPALGTPWQTGSAIRHGNNANRSAPPTVGGGAEPLT